MNAIKYILFALVLCGCGAAANFKEEFRETPVHVKSVGEGQRSYTYKHQGKNYIVVLGKDGKYYAIKPEAIERKAD